MLVKNRRQSQVAARKERSRRVQEAVEQAKSESSRLPDPIETAFSDGEAVEIVGSADAPTQRQMHRFRGRVGTTLPPYVAPPESPHAGKVVRPVKVDGKVVGIPEDRLRSVERGTGPARFNSSAFRRGWDRIFGRRA